MRHLFIAAAFYLAPLFAQVPTIGSITVTTDTNAVTIGYSVSPSIPYCQVLYDVVSGGSGVGPNYLWSSRTVVPSVSPGVCNVPILGLQDGGTYYFLPTARPNPDDNANIGYGTVQKVCPTCAYQLPLASANHLPVPPSAVQANLMCEPDSPSCSSYSTAYVTVLLSATGVNGECVSSSASPINPPSGYTINMSWAGGTITTINHGDSLSTILDPSQGKLWYGTVFQVPQGTSCIVPPNTANDAEGYFIPELPVDPSATGGALTAGNHRWIILRTAPGGPADFAPFGARTDPGTSWGSHYGGFQASTVEPDGGLFWSTEQFTGSPAHHWWFENLKFTVDETQTTAIWQPFIRFSLGTGGANAPFDEYMVYRGNYFHGPYRSALTNNTPSVSAAIEGTSGGQLAIVGNYVDNMWPNGGSLGQGIYLIGCGSGGETNVCHPDGPILIDNNYLHGLDMTIYVEEDDENAAIVYHDMTIAHNALHWPYPAAYDYAVALIADGCRDQFELKDGVRVAFKGNFIYGAYGCTDPGDPILFEINSIGTDIAVSSNVVTKAGDFLGAYGGLGADAVNKSYQVGMNRISVINNLAFDLGGNYRAGAGGSYQAFLITGDLNNLFIDHNSIVGPFTDGPYNGNYYSPWVIYDQEGANGIGTNFTLTNNIIPFGADHVPPSTAGIVAQSVPSSPGVLSHPTLPQPLQLIGAPSVYNYTQALGSFVGYTALTAGLGMPGATVISGGSGYPSTGNLAFTNCSNLPAGTFAASGGVINQALFSSYGSGCNPATMTVTASTSGGGSGAAIVPSYGLTPSYIWGGNIVTAEDYNGSDMTPEQVQSTCPGGSISSFAYTMPAGDTYPCQTTALQRRQAAGLVNMLASDYRIFATSTTSGYAGANINKIISDQGWVTNVSVAVSSSAVSITYTAPDARPVSVDVSCDSGLTWARHTDAGGSQLIRTQAFTGLPASTNCDYRVIDYFDQSAAISNAGVTDCIACGGWLLPISNVNLATDGTFTTLASGSSTPSFTFSLPSGATSFQVTLTAADGATQYTNTCSSSPCSISSVPNGDYLTVREFINGSTIVSSSGGQQMRLP